MARVKLRFFSLYSDVVGNELSIELEDGSRLSDLIVTLYEKYPRLRTLFDRVKPLILVNGVARDEEYIVKNGDEVAFIPPASGG